MHTKKPSLTIIARWTPNYLICSSLFRLTYNSLTFTHRKSHC